MSSRNLCWIAVIPAAFLLAAHGSRALAPDPSPDIRIDPGSKEIGALRQMEDSLTKLEASPGPDSLEVARQCDRSDAF